MSIEVTERLKKSWLEEIPKIENRAIDSEGIHNIYDQFKHDALLAGFNQIVESGSYPEIVTEFNVIESKLIVALETARSRYRLENRGLWARIAEGIGGIIYRIPRSQIELREKKS